MARILLRPQTFCEIPKAAKTADSCSSSHWVRLDEPGRYIGIWDDVDSLSSQNDVRKSFALQKIVEDDDVDNTQLKSLLRDIPNQVDGVAGVFLQEFFDDDIGENEPASGEGFPYEFPSLRSATGSFLSLITNQPYGRQSRWYFMESLTIEESQLGNPGVTWVNSKRFLRFQVIDNRLQAFIMCRTLVDRDHGEVLTESGFYQATTSFVTQLCELNAMYRPFKDTSTWEKAFSLQFCHANLLLYARCLLSAEDLFNVERGLTDPTRGAKLHQGSLGRTTRDYQVIQKFSEVADIMLRVIESLIEILQDAIRSTSESSAPTSRTSNISTKTSENPQLAAIELEIRLHCEQIRGCLSSLSTAMEHDLRLLELSREVKQTDSVQQLSILAAIFLPLSISSGVLSMQTRFKDLGMLLYDFFRVMIFLGALALCSILLLDFVKFVTGTFMGWIEIKLNRDVLYSERAPKEEQWLSTYKHFRMVGSVLWRLGLSLFCILLVVSFLIGMFRDVDLGARVLGYGIALMSFAAVIVVSLALLPSLRRKLVQLLRKVREVAQELPRVERRGQGREGDEEIATSCNSPEPTTRTPELASDVSNRENSEEDVPNE